MTANSTLWGEGGFPQGSTATYTIGRMVYKIMAPSKINTSHGRECLKFIRFVPVSGDAYSANFVGSL